MAQALHHAASAERAGAATQRPATPARASTTASARRWNIIRFCRSLSTLLAGGIPLVNAVELSARAVGNAVFERELLKVADSVREGQALWESLDRTGLMSDIAIQMVKVGESTGALDEMLDNASEFTDEEIDARLTRLISLVEPVMLVVMAVIVGIMLLSVYYPLIQVYGQAQA